MPSTILLVCTANVCRSPLAEQILRRGLAHDAHRFGPLGVSSLGAMATDGNAMCPVAAAALPAGETSRSFVDQHRSRAARRETVDSADLVIVMSREHRSVLAQLAPGTQTKTFTLLEVTALLEGAITRVRAGGEPAPRELRSLPAALNALRGTVRLAPVQAKRTLFRPRSASASEDLLSIPDGHLLGHGAHQRALAEVQVAASRFVAALGELGSLA